MPKSRRDRTVALTQVNKKSTKARKGALIEEIQQQADAFSFCWIFSLQHMRNNAIKEVREAWKGSRIFMGRNAVMRKALGATEEEEYKPGMHAIANLLEGDCGLLFTSEAPKVVTEWFASYSKPDFARTGNPATQTVTLSAGPVKLAGDENAPSSMHTELRKLGVPCDLQRGIPTLSDDYKVCDEGKPLKAEQAVLLRHLGILMASFEVRPLACVNLDTGVVLQAEEIS